MERVEESDNIIYQLFRQLKQPVSLDVGVTQVSKFSVFLISLNGVHVCCQPKSLN